MEFINMLNGLYPMSPKLVNHLSSIVKTVTLKKNEYLLGTWGVYENVFSVKEGLVRCFSLKKDGEEDCKWFMKENDMFYAAATFLTQGPSDVSIQALEACTLQYISYSEYEDLFRRFLEFNFHGRILIEKFTVLRDERPGILLIPDFLQRYIRLLQRHPEYISPLMSYK